jgi:aspartyl-tRNA(Asn)/glutamyl-tRNA(Gln) amidotransferase subunit C
MSVTQEQVLATAALCRLDLAVSSFHARSESEEERTARIASQLDAVVGYMDILNRVNTDAVAPLYSPLQRHVPPPRPDVAKHGLSADEVLANAPRRQQNFFAVPPVI